jgi:hypothetical protein
LRGETEHIRIQFSRVRKGLLLTSQETNRDPQSKRLTHSTIHVATETYTESHYVKAPRVGLNRVRISENDSEEAGDGDDLSDVQESPARRLHFADDAGM